MSRRRLLAALAFSGLGMGCAWALAPVAAYATSEFRAAEPTFGAPVHAPDGVLRIRKDVNGKGHFGASRNGGRTHRGIDVLSPVGDPVFASKTGRVAYATWQKGYGGVVKILHPGGTMTVYAHLSRITVRQGDWVVRSTLIGRTGKSGNASEAHTLPHVHYELRLNENVIDPAQGPFDKNIKIR